MRSPSPEPVQAASNADVDDANLRGEFGSEVEPLSEAAATGRVEPLEVAEHEAGLRLDRWFRRRFPLVSHGELERWLRSGQVRLDGRRARAGDRIATGQRVRVPPAAQHAAPEGDSQPARRPVSAAETAELEGRILYRDEHVLVLDKPAGLAVQGGSKTDRHLDGLLDALRFGAERPRLVHRLDKDTSGVLVLARTAQAATSLTAAFAARTVRKLYWAVVAGVPSAASGRISHPLAKRFDASGERVRADIEGRPAVTLYRVIERAGSRAAWLALEPRTGRTHQLRAHCALLGTPILGDGKYGGAVAFAIEGGGAGGLHLHARAIRFPLPDNRLVTVEAPLPVHLRETFRFFGFSEKQARGVPVEWDPPPRPATSRDGASERQRAVRRPPRRLSPRRRG